jgi:hypothetical protein
MLPGVDMSSIQALETSLREKTSAKAQKDYIRDFLREAADRLKEIQPGSGQPGSGNGAPGSLFDRAVEEESLLHSRSRTSYVVRDLPEKLVTSSQIAKKEQKENRSYEGLSGFQL